MSYQIKILSDEEFEKLPYREVDISLGLADTKTNTAYVRYVANEELQKYLINHELEHLVGADRDEIHHDGNGVYYKGFGNVFSALGQGASNIASGIGQGVGQLGSNIGRSIGGAASSIGQGISNLSGSLGKAMNFGGGFQGGANPSGGMLAAGASNPALRAPMDYFKSAPGSSISPFSMLSSGASSGALSPFGTSKASQSPIMQAFQPGGGQFGGKGASGSWNLPSSPKMSSQTAPIGVSANVDTPTQGQAPQQQPGQSNLFGNISKGLDLGGQVMSMFKGSGGMSMQGGGAMPNLPDLSQLPSVQAYKNFDFRGNLAQMDPALQDAINRDFDRIDAQEQHDFRNRWKNIRPGADIENDSVFARDYQALQQSQATRRADALAKYRMENMQFQFGVNQTEAERLMNLAQLDVDTISFNTGLDAQEAMQLKMIAGYGTQEETGIGGTLGQVGNIVNQAGGLMNSFGGG